MGYHTYFSLNIDPAPLVHHHPMYDIEIDSGYSTLSQLYNGVMEETTWYDCDEDMLDISRQYPDFLFILDGRGEESDDVWRSFYKNGKMYTWTLEYIIPDFDESKLEDVYE